MDVKWEPFPRHIVQSVDWIIEQRKKTNSLAHTVETKADWKIVHHLYSMWKYYFPKEHKDFIAGQKLRRATAKNKYASTKEKSGAEIRHTIEIPQRFLMMFNAYFPKQKLTKNFSHKIAKEIPDFKVPEKL